MKRVSPTAFVRFVKFTPHRTYEHDIKHYIESHEIEMGEHLTKKIDECVKYSTKMTFLGCVPFVASLAFLPYEPMATLLGTIITIPTALFVADEQESFRRRIVYAESLLTKTKD